MLEIRYHLSDKSSGNNRGREKLMKKRDKLVNIILVLVFFIGLSVLLYPTVSDYWNRKTQSRAVADYENKVSSITVED